MKYWHTSNQTRNPKMRSFQSNSILALVFCYIAACGKPQTDLEDTVIKVNPETATVSETETTTLGITAGPASGTNVAMPAGALSAGSTLNLEPIVTPASFELETVVAAGAAVSLSATDASGANVTELSSPMTLSLPLGATSLALGLVEKNNDNLCVLLSSSTNLIVWRASSITIAKSEGIDVAQIKSLRLGVFQLVYCGNETLEGFEEAIDSGAEGSGNQIAFTIDTGTYGMGSSKICVGVIGFTDIEGESDDPNIMIGGDEIKIDGTTQTVNFPVYPGTVTSETAETFLVLLYASSTQACPDSTPTESFDGANLSFQHVLGYPLSMATLSAVEQFDITIGKGDFSLMSVKYNINSDAATYSAKDACFGVESTDSGPYFAEYSKTIDVGNTISGSSEAEFYVPATSASTSETYKSRVRIGEKCMGSGDGTASYEIYYPTVKAGSLLTLRSIAFDVQTTGDTGRQLCMEFWTLGTLATRGPDSEVGAVLEAQVGNKEPAKQFFYPDDNSLDPPKVDLFYYEEACTDSITTLIKLEIGDQELPESFTPGAP